MSSAQILLFSCPNNPKCLSTAGGTTQGQSREAESPSSPCCPRCFCCNPIWGCLGCEHVLLAQVQLFIHDSLQVLLHRAFNVFFSQSLLISQIALQYLPAGLVECYEVFKDPFLELFPEWHFFLLHRFLHSWHQNDDTIIHFPLWGFIPPFAQQVCKRLTLAEWH